MQPRNDSFCRLEAATLLRESDRVPTIGGWIGGVRVLADLAGISPEHYLEDPFGGVLKAHHALGVDGMVSPAVPTDLEQIRTGHLEEAGFADRQPEELLADAERLPDDATSIRAEFDWAGEESRFREYYRWAMESWGGLVPVPNHWELGGHFPLYHMYGYGAFLGACALYPEAVERIWWFRSVQSRCRAEIMVGLYREYGLLPTLFCGEDLFTAQGPMTSPTFLRERYLPTVKMIIEPLVEAGVRLIHHCDGDVRPLAQDFLDIGFRGFQGFQYEFGVSIRALRELRTAFGEPPVIWAGMSVSRTLPFGDEDAVRAEIDGFVRDTDGGIGLCVFTSNVTGVEVPADNLRAGYGHARSVRRAVER